MMLAFRNSKGFTLLELLIVIVLMSFSVSLVGPSLFNQIEKSKINAEINQMEAQLHLIQQRTFLSRHPLVLSFSGKEMHLFELGDEPDEGMTIDAEVSTLAEYSYDYLFFKPVTIIYNQYGQPSDAYLEASVEQKEYQVVLPKTF